MYRLREIALHLRQPKGSTQMESTTTTARIIGPDDGAEGFLGSIGVRFMIDGPDTRERFSLVEHPMSAHALAAPLHVHTREDEYSYRLEAALGLQSQTGPGAHRRSQLHPAADQHGDDDQTEKVECSQAAEGLDRPRAAHEVHISSAVRPAHLFQQPSRIAVDHNVVRR